MRAEQPAAQVPSGGAKPLRMSCEADGVPLHALEHAARKDDLVTLDPGQLVEAHLGRTELTALERDHAPPEDVAASDLAAEVCQETFGVLARGRQRFHADLAGARAELRAGRDEDHQRPRFPSREHEARLKAGQRAPRPDVDVDVLDRAEIHTRACHEPAASGREQREVLTDDGQRARLGAEVLPDGDDERRLLLGTVRHRLLVERPASAS
jgi:hypothetical protein